MPKGYQIFNVTKKRSNEQTERKVWCLFPHEQENMYAKLLEIQCAVEELRAKKLLPKRWNKHDDSIIAGLPEHVCPCDLNGKGLDPNEEQIFKFLKALNKLAPGSCQTLDDFSEVVNISRPRTAMTPEGIKDHMDEKRRIDSWAKKLGKKI